LARQQINTIDMDGQSITVTSLKWWHAVIIIYKFICFHLNTTQHCN